MLNKFSIILLLIFVSAGITQAQTRFIEKVEKRKGAIVIPYEKYKLPNGLTLIVHEDHSDPIVHVDVTYHVGSAREVIGRSGFAHFFEHMMFQGSDHVADEEHFKIISEAGGTLNGSTNTDRTNYFETLPSNQLEIALWLEADRMGFLLDAVTQKKFEVQRATVKNERGQRVDNRPYGRVNEKICQALYPFGHPYSWPTIGWMEDLDKADVNDLKRFFLRWYGPNNAVLTVAGDVNVAETVKLAEKYFGSIQAGPEVEMPGKIATVLDKDRHISYEDNIRFPLINITFPTVPNYHPDEAPLDILANIMGGTPNSIFYKNFVKSQIAVNAMVEHPAYEISGQFNLKVYALPEKSPADIEKLIRESILEFEKRGVSDDDLNSFKATFEAGVISSLESVSGKAAQLAAYETFLGNANFTNVNLDRYEKVTKEDVIRVFNKYIKNKFGVVLSVYPKGKPELIAKPDNFKLPAPDGNLTVKDENEKLVYNKPKDTFDRSKKPEQGPNPVIKVPEFWKSTFPNGLKVIASENNEIPMVALQLSIEAGHFKEGDDIKKAGIAELLAGMLNESTEKYTTEQISEKLDKLGSSITVASDKNYITVTVSSLAKKLDKTLILLEERLFHPRFDVKDFERVKNQHLQGIANQGTQPVTIANNVYNYVLHGKDNILGIPTSGTEETVKNISLDDVKAYYQNNFSPSISNLVIVGDVDKNTIVSKLNFLLNTWKAKPVTKPKVTPVPSIDKTRIYLVDKEGAPQSEIRIGYMAMPFDAFGEYYKSNLMNYILGGDFNSRINLKLREEKGYTYGARSGFSGDQYTGQFTASAAVRGNVTDSAVAEFVNEIKKYVDSGILDSELGFTKKSIGQSDALKYETPVQKISFLKRIIIYDLDKTFVEKQNEILKNITKEEINALAKKELPLHKMVIVVVGDKKTTLPGLRKLGYEVIELDKTGIKSN